MNKEAPIVRWKAREMAFHYYLLVLCPIMEVPTILFYTGIATKRKPIRQ